jgi:NAD(P)-dependent dehydrogenase (short-subunit alcohol dehydrogenase family)
VSEQAGTIATLRFLAGDQQSFAQLSGDFNPLHLDPAAARRTVAGEPIVHGMHLLLRTLDAHFSSARPPARLAIAATFHSPAVLGETIRVERDAGASVCLEATGRVTIANATLSALAARESERRLGNAARPTDTRTSAPKVRDLADLDAAHGHLALPPVDAVCDAFPEASRALGGAAVGSLAAISRLVGMECPGRDSLLSAVRLEVVPHAAADALAWSVARTDKRFALVRINVDSGAVAGQVDAFVRQPPADAPSAASIRARIPENTFTGQRALVVGGSRGLGAATALIIAAGGGAVLATYATGAADAAALMRDAAAGGIRIDMIPFDAVHSALPALTEAAAGFGPTHLYYYATPRIFVPRREPFDEQLFERFAAFYVTGFARVCRAVRAAAPSLTVFYPSTTAIDEGVRELGEYAAAKAAGESVCRQLALADPGLSVLVRRLSRVRTDQTASILAAAALDPVDVLLPVLRDAHRSRLVPER